MDKTIYVKITNNRKDHLRWYDEIYFIGAIYEVESENDDLYYVKTPVEGTGIMKSDCEVVPTLQPENSLSIDQKDTLFQAVKCLEMHGEQKLAQQVRRDFPTVFVPAKTYKPGDKIAIDKTVYTLAVVNYCTISLIADDYLHHWGEPFKVQNYKAITQHELEALVGTSLNGKQKPFTLLPDTTDQMV